jgi:hypothetical protein
LAVRPNERYRPHVRRIFSPVALGVVAAAFLAGPAAASSPVSSAQLALMPLPKTVFPAAAGFLPLDPDSGVVSNKDAADEATGDVTAAALTRLGRVTGYELDYTDSALTAIAKGHGLLGIETSVELFSSAARAHKGMAFWRKDETNFGALQAQGLKVSFKPVAAPRVGDERWSFAGHLALAGKPPMYGIDIVFRVGPLIADVTVTAADPASVRPLAISLARKLERRIRQVLAGKVKGPPTPLPAKAKAGPPGNGMDLSAMAIRPSDLGGGKVTRQGYQLDPDLMPVSEYVREISGSPFTTFEEEIQLFHSATEAGFNVSLLATALTVSQAPKNGKKAKPDQIASEKTTNVKVTAGDEARAMLASVRFGDGTTVNEGFVLVRVGSLVAFVSVGTPGNVAIPPKVLVQVARLAAERLSAGLSKSPVA